jgi:hypothetical protein
LPRISVIAICSVWNGVSFCVPRGCVGVSRPLTSTCGGWPTEKLRSLILSETSSMRSMMGGRSKKLIPFFGSRKALKEDFDSAGF